MDYFIFTKYDELTGKLTGLMIKPQRLSPKTDYEQQNIVGYQIGDTGMLRIQWSYDQTWSTVNYLGT
jgi:hypothetical protein